MIEIIQLRERHHPDDPFWHRRRWCEVCDRRLELDEEYTCCPCDEARDEERQSDE